VGVLRIIEDVEDSQTVDVCGAFHRGTSGDGVVPCRIGLRVAPAASAMFNGTESAARRNCSVRLERPFGMRPGNVAENASNSTAQRYTSSFWKLSMPSYRPRAAGPLLDFVAADVAVAVAVHVNDNDHVNDNVNDPVVTSRNAVAAVVEEVASYSRIQLVPAIKQRFTDSVH
jgi:hypothetical protein